MKKITDKYYYKDIDRSYKEIAGEPIFIEGFEDLDFFTHKPVGDEGTEEICISEGVTGMRLSWGDNLQDAIDGLAMKLHDRDKQYMRGKIKKTISEYGLSPRYKEVNHG